jgi:hypothetical protein
LTNRNRSKQYEENVTGEAESIAASSTVADEKDRLVILCWNKILTLRD